MLTKEQVRAAMLDKISKSMLTAKDVKELGFVAYASEEVAKKPKLEVDPPAGGFVIPYYDINRKYTDFFRFRYLEQPHYPGFTSLLPREPRRYHQLKGMRPHVYFSPLWPWDEFFARKQEDPVIFITEGELKANCACKLGFPTLALGGVWNFMSKREGIALLPEIKALPLDDYKIYIVFDSDIISKPDVLRAENELAREMLRLGWSIYTVRIPPGINNAKLGLDDFLYAKGKNAEQAFTDLVATAKEWAKSKELHELNEEVIFLRESSTVLELATRYRWRASEFAHAVFANRTYKQQEGEGKKIKFVEKSAAHEWLKWEERAQLDSITYAPGSPLIVDSQNKKFYNCWQGWGLTNGTIKKGNVDPWRKLLDFLFAGHEAQHRNWFEQWIAYPLQHPGTKLFSTTVFWGPPRTGKSLVGYTLRRIYGTNWTKVTERELHANFNEWAECKQFALGEEITGGDKRGVADALKDLITQEELRINPKHIKQYTVPDCINWLFTSNHCDAFFLEDADKRFFVIEIKNQPMERDFYRAYDKWYRSDEGAGALFYHLLNVDLTGFDPMDHAPETRSKLEMIADGRSDIGAWCAQLRENPDSILNVNGGPPNPRKLWTTTELHELYDRYKNTRLTVNGLSRELKRSGFIKALDGMPFFTETGLVKAWIVRDVEEVRKIKRPKKLGELYSEEMKAWLETKKVYAAKKGTM